MTATTSKTIELAGAIYKGVLKNIDKGVFDSKVDAMHAIEETGKVLNDLTDQETKDYVFAMRLVWKRLQVESEKEVPAIAPAKTTELVPTKALSDEQDGDTSKEHPAHRVPNGYYTVKMANGEHRTYRLKDHWVEEEAKVGVQVAYLLTGPDNSNDYSGMAFVKGAKVYAWKKFKGNTMAVTGLNFLVQGSHGEAGEMFAMKSGKCWRCGHKLTVPASLHRGLGPICAQHLGLA